MTEHLNNQKITSNSLLFSRAYVRFRRYIQISYVGFCVSNQAISRDEFSEVDGYSDKTVLY